MLRLLENITLAALDLLSFGAGAIRTAILHHDFLMAMATLKKVSKQTIKPVHPMHDHGSLTAATIQPSDSHIIHFSAPAESS